MEPPANYHKYGVPFYVADWAPPTTLRKSEPHDPDHHDNDKDDRKRAETETENAKSKRSERTEELAKFDPNQNHVVLAGGGGEGNSGIPNAILLAQFDPASLSLSPNPVAKLNTSSDLPYRMAIHPGGDGLVCSFPNSCRWFEWDEESGEVPKLGLRQSKRVLDQLEDVGQQLALAFNRQGSVLASGGEDGKLRVFKWPSMEIMFNENQAHNSVKQLDFSPDGKFLVSLGSSGPGRVWDVTSSTVVASLPPQKDEVFCGCRFSLSSDGNHILYVADKSGRIVTWNTTSWKRIRSKTIARDVISAFDVSADGKLLACGTTQGDLVIVNSTRMRIQKVVKKAHMGFVTALSFSHDSRALASASLDSSARVSIVEDEKKNGGPNLWVIILIILVAIEAYFLKNPDKLLSFNS